MGIENVTLGKSEPLARPALRLVRGQSAEEHERAAQAERRFYRGVAAESGVHEINLERRELLP